MTDPSQPEPLNTTLDWLCKQCQEILQLVEVAPTENLFDIGGDSLAVIELMAATEDEWGVEIPIDRILDASDLTEIASSINAGLAEHAGK